MPADFTEKNKTVEQQAISALQHLDAADQQKVLEYIASLIDLSDTNHDEASIG
jgi:GTP1/Obg family GTP-binding protein